VELKNKKYHTIGTVLKSNRKTKKYHTVGTVLKSNRKIVERGKMDTSITHKAVVKKNC
jgi:hypothetical protein